MAAAAARSFPLLTGALERDVESQLRRGELGPESRPFRLVSRGGDRVAQAGDFVHVLDFFGYAAGVSQDGIRQPELGGDGEVGILIERTAVRDHIEGAVCYCLAQLPFGDFFKAH